MSAGPALGLKDTNPVCASFGGQRFGTQIHI